ncbi:MAG: PAS domain-containing protein, partial [Bacteroidales bacterium]|nr:PAS domain-containing protein [Bacteroidales bacterium]
MKLYTREVFILFICLLFSFTTFATRKKILVIHSYHQGLVWTDNITKGIQSVFDDRHDIELHFEYLDTKRNPQVAYRKKLAELYKEKLHTIPYEVIITVDNNALDFVKKYQDQYFKDIPVVFCGINHFKEADREGTQNVSGITEDVDYKSTIDLILKVHPGLSRLIVISDDKTASSLRNSQEIERLRNIYYQDLDMSFLEDFTKDELADTVSKLEANSAILLLYFNKDKAGKYISFKESIEFVSQASPVPIYSSWKFHLGEGIVGGMLTSGFEQGRMAAQMTEKVMNGADVNMIPLVTQGYNHFGFDYKQLKRFGVNQVLLPVDSEIINQPPDFFEKYKFYIWISSAFIIILIITVLTITLKRKQNERRLMAINAELDRRVEERTDELKTANNVLTDQKQQISNQNSELEKHRHHLLELVDEKTQDLKEANEKLEDSHKRLMHMLEANSDGVWEHNLNTGQVYFSEEFWDKLGYAIESIENTKKFVEIHTHPDDNPLIEQRRQEYLDGKTEKFKVEFRLQTQNGEWKWFHAKGRTLKWDDDGNP